MFLDKYFKRYDELEEEVIMLRKIVKEQNNFLASIYEKCNEYKKKNLSIGWVGFERIKELASNGMELTEIKKEIDY